MRIPLKIQKYLFKVPKNNLKLYGKGDLIEKIITYLSMDRKCNTFITGYEGVGKNIVVREISKVVSSKKCPRKLRGYEVLKLSLNNLNKIDNEVYARHIVKYIIRFCKKNSSRIILYIDNYEDILNYPELCHFSRMSIIESSMKMILKMNYNSINEMIAGDYELLKNSNVIALNSPEIEEVEKIIRDKAVYMQKKYKIKISENLIKFVAMTGTYLAPENYYNPELSITILDFAFIHAYNKRRKFVTKEDILEFYCFDEDLNNKIEENERVITAYHEIGHYIVAQLSENLICNKNAFVCILPIGSALGLTADYYQQGKKLTFGRDYFIDEIAYCLGGRVGENLYTNNFSSGANSDLQNASNLAEEMIINSGLSSNESRKNISYMLDDGIKDYLLTDKIKNEINQEISDIISEAYARAESIISNNQGLIKILVKKLLKDGILLGVELDEIIKKYKEK